MMAINEGNIMISHRNLEVYTFHPDVKTELPFSNNETNYK